MIFSVKFLQVCGKYIDRNRSGGAAFVISAGMRIFASEYYLECEIHIKFREYLLLNDILKQIFASLRKSEANIRCNMDF
jgi:hypothetical protein